MQYLYNLIKNMLTHLASTNILYWSLCVFYYFLKIIANILGMILTLYSYLDFAISLFS